MDSKERSTILLRATAIKLFEQLQHCKISDSIKLEFTGLTLNVRNPNSMSGKNNPVRNWDEKIAQIIFIPLLEQGLDRYKEEVQKVAETGEVPVA